MKFFLVGVIFLVFDVEICLVLPLPFSHLFVLLFFIILILGLLYEWYYGGLEWFYVNGRVLGYIGCSVYGILAHCVNDNRSKFDIIPTDGKSQMKKQEKYNTLFYRSKVGILIDPRERYFVWHPVPLPYRLIS